MDELDGNQSKLSGFASFHYLLNKLVKCAINFSVHIPVAIKAH
jgi:hypothetical protein